MVSGGVTDPTASTAPPSKSGMTISRIGEGRFITPLEIVSWEAQIMLGRPGFIPV